MRRADDISENFSLTLTRHPPCAGTCGLSTNADTKPKFHLFEGERKVETQLCREISMNNTSMSSSSSPLSSSSPAAQATLPLQQQSSALRGNANGASTSANSSLAAPKLKANGDSTAQHKPPSNNGSKIGSQPMAAPRNSSQSGSSGGDVGLRSFDMFASNASFPSFGSFSSLPSLPSIPAMMEKEKVQSNEPAHRDVTVTSTTTNVGTVPNGSGDHGRLVTSTGPTNSTAGATSTASMNQRQPQSAPSQPAQAPSPRGARGQGRSAQQQPPQPAQMQPQPGQNTQQQANGNVQNAVVPANQNQNDRRIINPVTVPNGQNFVDITEYLNMPQSEAAKKLSIPPSTLSKRWKEAVRNRKWPWRVVCKLDKEIMTLLHNVPQGAAIPEEIEGRLGYLMRKRQEELKPVVIRL